MKLLTVESPPPRSSYVQIQDKIISVLITATLYQPYSVRAINWQLTKKEHKLLSY